MKLKTRIIVGFVAIILLPLLLFSASLYGFSQTQAKHVQESSSQASDSSQMVYDISLPQSSSSQVKLMAKDMILTATIILVFTALSVGLWIYRSIAVPLVKLKKATKNIKEGNLDFVLEVEGNDEFSQLCQDFEEMRKRLKESTEEKILMDKENKELISNISHDLKTPITAVKGYVEGIMDGVADTPEKMDRYVRTIYNKTNEMDHLINELTFYSKIDTNRIPYTFSKLNVEDYFSDCAEELGLEMETRGIELVYANYVEKGVQVIADGEQIRRVIHNIVSNAIKYMEKPRGIIQLRVKDVGDFIQVEIEDNGKGIAAKDLPNIFDRFYRTDSSRNSSKGGSGIGLSYAKSLITHHKGRVGASNAAGKGAIFYFELPLFTDTCGQLEPASVEAATGVEVNEPDRIDYTFLKKYSVMVVEDTPELRSYLKETLSNYFARVYVAKDGKEGLEQIKDRLPDIIISDVMMPRMNGFELCREVKTNLDISHIPFVLLTAYHNSQNMYTGYKTGADAFLPKPFEIDGLLALIHNQLRQREQIRARYKDDKLLTHKEVSFSNADETFLLKLNTLIADNMSNPDLDVAFIATNMCISRSLLFNKVKAITGMGIVDYVNKQRIEQSIVLLTTTTMNITEISEVVGFSSLRYFSKVFKSIKGEIPSAYRKQDK